MNGYKTSGDWADITSIGRNEIVFEGRHKAYGAFYIRQRYSNALLLALLSAITFVGLCAFIPYALRGIAHPKPLPKTDMAIKPTDEVLIHQQIIIHPPISHPPIHPPKGSVTHQGTPPVISNQPIIDTALPVAHNPLLAVETPGNTGGTVDMNPTPAGPPASEPTDNTPLTWVSEMPKFPGKIDEYMAQNIQYPPDEIRSGIQGTVYASFIVEKDGSVSNIRVVRGISNGQDLNREAIRVLSEMPKWTPGKQNGHPVRIQYILPINFKLQ